MTSPGWEDRRGAGGRGAALLVRRSPNPPTPCVQKNKIAVSMMFIVAALTCSPYPTWTLNGYGLHVKINVRHIFGGVEGEGVQ